MRKFEVVTKYINEDISIPVRGSKSSAGYDLASISDTVINPGEIKLINTGLKVLLPEDEVLLVFPRSSLGLKKGLMLSNSVGVIDSDYYNNDNNEGHIMIPLYNFSQNVVTVEKGERVAQGIFIKYFTTTDDSVINDRTGGFGSTGTK